jgi:hypothetical protein
MMLSHVRTHSLQIQDMPSSRPIGARRQSVGFGRAFRQLTMLIDAANGERDLVVMARPSSSKNHCIRAGGNHHDAAIVPRCSARPAVGRNIGQPCDLLRSHCLETARGIAQEIVQQGIAQGSPRDRPGIAQGIARRIAAAARDEGKAAWQRDQRSAAHTPVRVTRPLTWSAGSGRRCMLRANLSANQNWNGAER